MRKVLVMTLVALMSATFLVSVEASPSEPAARPGALQGHAACAGVSLENPSTPECEAFMAARPTPNVSQMPADLGIISDITFIRFNRNQVPIYNGPDGAQVDTLVTGYMYVAPLAFEDGYAQLSARRWVSLNDATFGSPSSFSGVTINGALDMPFAWILWGHDAVKSPAGVPDRENGHYERFQLVNIYATVNVNGWDWHLIGPGHWTNQQNLSIVYPSAPADFGGNWVGINIFEQNLVAYSGGAPVMATLVSSGVRNGEWDTRLGTFDVDTRVEAGTMNGREGSPDFYSLDLVPYAQYFDGLISLHGTYWHNSFGYPHSHGCVNLSVSDAKWLFGWMGEGSVVHVYLGET